MKKVKFKAFDMNKGRMIHNVMVMNGKPCLWWISQFDNHIEYEEIHGPLLQYTGLQDKNGKEICEGDIIELVNADLETIKVVCEFGKARRQIFENFVEITGFYFKRLCDNRKTFPIINNYADTHDLELFEVIGNIYEDSKLLEVGE